MLTDAGRGASPIRDLIDEAPIAIGQLARLDLRRLRDILNRLVAASHPDLHASCSRVVSCYALSAACAAERPCQRRDCCRTWASAPTKMCRLGGIAAYRARSVLDGRGI